MSHVVAKDFKSINRVFKAGDPIAPDDIDPETALSFEQWKAGGFIVEASASAPIAASAPPDHPVDESRDH